MTKNALFLLKNRKNRQALEPLPPDLLNAFRSRPT